MIRRGSKPQQRRPLRALIAEVCAVVAGWKEAFSAQGVSDQGIDYLARFIDRDALREQREEFSKSP